MSFQNYDFQNQQGQQEGAAAGPGAPAQQEQVMGGQMPMPDSAGQQFQGGNGGEPGSAGGQVVGDAKTTLWCVLRSVLMSIYPRLS